MKKKFIKTGLILFCILVIGLFCFWYQDINYDPDFTYEKLDDGTLRLNKYNGDDLIVKIPEKVRGRKVTQIGKECFYKKNGISGMQVSIPDTVTVIGPFAFENCTDITVTGAENVEEIQTGAFSKCSFAMPYPFSGNLINIGSDAFLKAKGIGKVQLNEKLEHIGGDAFRNAELEDIEIPESVLYIGNGAFYHTEWFDARDGYVIVGQNILIKCPEQETVMIPDGVRMVSLSGCLENENLKDIYIPRSVEVIENPIASRPQNDISIYIPAEVEVIERQESTNDKMVTYGIEKALFIVEKASYAETYAKEMAEKYGAKYKIMDKIEYPE